MSGSRPVPNRPWDGRLWENATWRELGALGLGPRGSHAAAPVAGASPTDVRRGVVALLPVGAIEAHGPHLPLGTDVIIAAAAAKATLPALQSSGRHPLVLPPLAYTAAPFAAAFPGTLSVRPSTVTALLTDIAASLQRQGAAALVVVNAHLDPAHLVAIREAASAHHGPMPFVHPDLTARRWARCLTAEFRSGACHAGQYETSVVMAAAPDLVREDRRGLPARPVSLSDAIRAGTATFEDAGMPDAYCGDPAAATADEGRGTIAALAGIVADAVAEALDEP